MKAISQHRNYSLHILALFKLNNTNFDENCGNIRNVSLNSEYYLEYKNVYIL